MIRIELLSAENFKVDSLDNYPRKQDVKKVYRKHNGEYILVDCVYTDDWDMEKRRSVAKDISSDDYITYLAIENDEARKAGAQALYISACSSEETIAFYKAMGAKMTDCPIKEIAEDEPYDVQMVCYVS